jgi:hypothetical protein
VTLIDVFSEEPFTGTASIDNLHACVSQVMIDGLRAVSLILTKQGIRHSLVGGMAVACHGYPRTTDNMDFAVRECAFEYHDKITLLRAGLPVKYMGIRVNYVTFTTKIEKELLEQYLEVPSPGGIPVMPLGPLIAMKLMANRLKDKADVCEMLKRRGLREVEAVMKWIAEGLPSHAGLMAELVAAADNERTK